MKKIFMSLVLATMAAGATAQNDYRFEGRDTETTKMISGDDAEMAGEKYSVLTNSFWHNWFVQANASFTSFWSDQEHGYNIPSDFNYSFRSNVGLSLAVGKWFTPGIGLRTKLNGFWGRSVVSTDKATNANYYWTLSEQALLNMSNLLYGYNEERLYNCIPYLGLTYGRSMTHSSGGIGYTFGLLNTFRYNEKFSFNLDINYTVGEPRFDGIQGIYNGYHDRMLNIEVGVTYNLGKSTWKKAPDLDGIRTMHQMELDAMNAQIRDLQMENERLRKK